MFSLSQELKTRISLTYRPPEVASFHSVAVTLCSDVIPANENTTCVQIYGSMSDGMNLAVPVRYCDQLE